MRSKLKALSFLWPNGVRGPLALGSVTYLIFSISTYAQSPAADDAITRNIASTPPYSVLPSSPAIASRGGQSNPAQVLKLKAQLLRLGYEVGSLDAEITAKFKSAVFYFQTAKNLPATGSLDPTTIDVLERIEK